MTIDAARFRATERLAWPAPSPSRNVVGRVFPTGTDEGELDPPLSADRKRARADIKASLLRATRVLVILSWLGISPLWTVQTALGQDATDSAARFLRERSKSSPAILRAFAPAIKSALSSIVRLNVGGKEAALGTVVDLDGLALSKASELTPDNLTATLPNGQTVPAEILGIDEENDLALVRISAAGLKPVHWSSRPVRIGEWAITPGIEATPEAVGIVSAAARQILWTKALIGVSLNLKAADALIESVVPGFSAEKAGLRAGDHVLKLNDVVVTNGQDLVEGLSLYREGQFVKLRIQREQRQWDANLQLLSQAEGRWSRLKRQARMDRLGSKLSRRAEGFPAAIQHDTVLQAWQCGGPLLNLDGEAIGLNIARAGRVASYALPAAQVREVTEELKKEETLSVKHEESKAPSN